MEKTVLFYFYEGMADFEIAFLIALLSTMKNGRKVVSVSEDTKPLKSAYGITFVPEIKINSINFLDNIDAMVIPGGMSAGISEDLGGLIRKLDEQKKLLAAICLSFLKIFWKRGINYSVLGL